MLKSKTVILCLMLLICLIVQRTFGIITERSKIGEGDMEHCLSIILAILLK